MIHRFLFCLLWILLLSFSSKSFAAVADVDSPTPTLSRQFYFAEAPRLWLQPPSMADYHRNFYGRDDDYDKYERKQATGITLLAIGGSSFVAGVALLAHTMSLAGSYLTLDGAALRLLGSVALIGVGLGLGIPGLVMTIKYGKKRRAGE